MDQIKIGKFIAECRKKKNLTQSQLAEKLGITDRAISKWENGRAMPDSSLMISLCNILEITVNDLLSGCLTPKASCDKELEDKLIEVIKQKEESDKHLLVLEWVIGILSIAILFMPIIIASVLELEAHIKIILCFSGFLPCLIGTAFALRIEQVAGYYKCDVCGHKYVPTFKMISVSTHIGRTRKMKCPKCAKKSWHKKVISKD